MLLFLLTPTTSGMATSRVPLSCKTTRDDYSRRRQLVEAVCTVLALPVMAVAQEAPRPTLNFRMDDGTGVMIADILPGTGAIVQPNSKVNIHITGRLLGKNGWIFENSVQDGEPYRLQLGTNSVIPGLEVGLMGMAEGGKRRIVIPSTQGYRTKQMEPIPREFGNRQRLYTTVLNSVRVDRERSQLGSDIAGKVVFDVELLRLR
jgi:FKBP-type peptidyl-prolyl cis-trans isomerase